MMKIKSHALLSILTLVMMACSESGYTPANTQPAQIPPPGYAPGYTQPLVNGVPINPNGPMMPMRPAPTFVAPGLQVNAHAGFQFNWQTSPYYYLKNPNANCSLRRQADYTPNRCACYQAPCNCQEVMRQVQARCPYNPRTTTTTTVVETVTTRHSRGSCTAANPTCGTSNVSAGSAVATPVASNPEVATNGNPVAAQPVSETAPAASTTATETTPATDTLSPITPTLNLPNTANNNAAPVLTPVTSTSATTASSGSVDEAAGLVLFSTHGVDAKALYDRLAKKADEEKDAMNDKIHVIRGQNYKCSMAKVGLLASKEKKDKAYNCDFDIGATLGLVKMQSSVSADGPSILTVATNFDGETVKVGGRGLQPDEGMILIKGTQASLFYDALNTDAKLGMMNSDSGIQANVKILGHLKCSRTLDVSAKTECQIKISTKNGAALDAI